MEENKFIAYGKDDLTFSLNLQEINLRIGWQIGLDELCGRKHIF